MTQDVRIVALSARGDASDLMPQVDAIFFEASATKYFPDTASRAAFRERWLGRYLAHFPESVFVALGPSNGVLGYVCGSPRDAASDPLFSDISYFPLLSEHTTRFPAHLHINLAEDARNRGIGGRLIDAFVAQARVHGACGVHVVTSAASRNRAFYNRQGFKLVATLMWSGNEIVMLGRPLDRLG